MFTRSDFRVQSPGLLQVRTPLAGIGQFSKSSALLVDPRKPAAQLDLPCLVLSRTQRRLDFRGLGRVRRPVLDTGASAHDRGLASADLGICFRKAHSFQHQEKLRRECLPQESTDALGGTLRILTEDLTRDHASARGSGLRGAGFSSTKLQCIAGSATMV